MNAKNNNNIFFHLNEAKKKAGAKERQENIDVININENFFTKIQSFLYQNVIKTVLLANLIIFLFLTPIALLLKAMESKIVALIIFFLISTFVGIVIINFLNKYTPKSIWTSEMRQLETMWNLIDKINLTMEQTKEELLKGIQKRQAEGQAICFVLGFIFVFLVELFGNENSVQALLSLSPLKIMETNSYSGFLLYVELALVCVYLFRCDLQIAWMKNVVRQINGVENLRNRHI
jgi:hypothetical protein